MKIIRSSKLPFVPASHEDPQNPQVVKKVLFTYQDLITGRIQMINWTKLPAAYKSRAHYHEDMQEIFILISGQATMAVNNEIEVLQAGDGIIVPIKHVHTMENIGAQDVEYLVIGISTGTNGKSVTLEP